jgi:hypothetical protein
VLHIITDDLGKHYWRKRNGRDHRECGKSASWWLPALIGKGHRQQDSHRWHTDTYAYAGQQDVYKRSTAIKKDGEDFSNGEVKSWPSYAAPLTLENPPIGFEPNLGAHYAKVAVIRLSANASEVRSMQSMTANSIASTLGPGHLVGSARLTAPGLLCHE